MDAVVVGLVLVAAMAGAPYEVTPGDALTLDPPVTVGNRSGRATHAPVRAPRPHAPYLPVGGVALATGGLVAVRHRFGGRRDDEPLFVVVHGHGGSTADFDTLIAQMGVDRDRVVAFDYSTIDGGRSSTESSRVVSSRRTAAALDRFMRAIAERHSNIYSIHHSKGASAGALMISAIDDGTKPAIDGYRGAALLDPPMARGLLGGLQSAGQIVPWIPDDGGFDPVTCDLSTCHDLRSGLGDRAGVEVVMIRNPDAAITNVATVPDGLRVYDLVDDGDTSAWKRWWNPVAFVKRVFVAHGSVLRHQAVADCIVDEAASPGSCAWTGGAPARSPSWGSGGGFNLAR